MSVTLHPSSALGFNRPLTQHVKKTLTLSNHNAQPVAFKVKTTAPKLYCVRPNSGRVEPGESVEVQVMLQAMKEEPPLNAKCKDKFLIQSTLITPEKAALPLHDIWSSTESGDPAVNSQKLRVVYLPSESPTVPEEDEGPSNIENSMDASRFAESKYETVRGFPPNGGPEPMEEAISQGVDYEQSQEEPILEIPTSVNVTVHAPPPREPTPPKPTAPSRSRSHNEEMDRKLAEATAEINRLRSLLAAMPDPSRATGDNELRSRKRRTKSTGETEVGSVTDAGSYVEEQIHPEGVPLQVVIIIAVGVFITTYLFF